LKSAAGSAMLRFSPKEDWHGKQCAEWRCPFREPHFEIGGGFGHALVFPEGELAWDYRFHESKD
jgi:hypothetical protein